MLALHALAPGFVHTELLTPDPHFSYRPLAVLEPFTLGEPHQLDLSRLACEVGATFTRGALTEVDPQRQVARTSAGGEIAFDVLVLACGTTAGTWLEGALTFRGSADASAFRSLFEELETGTVRRLAFVLPATAGWPLPLYELALLTASHLAARRRERSLAFVTPEERPLALFGQAPSATVENLLAERGVTLLTGRRAVGYDGEELVLDPPPPLRTERVVTLPILAGRPITGIPHDSSGFVPVDAFGRVKGLRRVFAAGDITTYPVKQGGLATQAADAVAETIAAEAGAPVVAEPFRPVLRGLLLTGAKPAFMQTDPSAPGDEAVVSAEPLWWPPAKIVGRYLAPVVARSLRYGETAPTSDGIPVNVELGAP